MGCEFSFVSFQEDAHTTESLQGISYDILKTWVLLYASVQKMDEYGMFVRFTPARSKSQVADPAREYTRLNAMTQKDMT